MKSKTFRDNEATDQPFVRDYPGEPVPEERFTHSHPYEAEEEKFTQTTRSIVWELIPFWASEGC